MDRRFLQPFITILCFTALLHITATLLKIYSYTHGFDKIVHYCAGITIGLFYLLFRNYFRRSEHHLGFFFTLLIFAVAIGTAWEIFEVHIGFAPMIGGYWNDTIFDMVANVLGALTMYFLYNERHEIDA